MVLNWYGDAIKRRVESAVQAGMNETLAATVAPAKARARRDTGLLQGSIQFRAVVKAGGGWFGLIGAFNVFYALFQEIGTRRQSGTRYLTIAAQQTFPQLTARIRANYGG